MSLVDTSSSSRSRHGASKPGYGRARFSLSLGPTLCDGVRFVAALSIIGLINGCSLFYDHHVEGDGFDFYSDRSPQELASTVDYVDHCVSALGKLFGAVGSPPPAPRILYDEPALQASDIYSREAPEGYYLPMFRMVHLSPRELPRDVTHQDLAPSVYSTQAVILHELTHHYLIHRHPRLNSTYWLNEGLACLLELGYFDERGELQLPLFHPWLHEQARIAALHLGRDGLDREVRRLVRTGWFGFHQQQSRTRNYALSTAMVRVLLDDFPGDLPSRIEQLVHLDEDETIRRLTSRLHAEVVRPNPEHLYEIWRAGDHSAWALAQWTEWVTALPRRVDDYWVRSLLQWSESPSDQLRSLGVAAAARLLGRATLAPFVADRLTDRLTLALVWEPGMFLSILPELNDAGASGRLYRPTVDLLDAADPEVRVEAARALARWGGKRTITRPTFWRSASPTARSAEVSEWRQWIGVQYSSSPSQLPASR